MVLAAPYPPSRAAPPAVSLPPLRQSPPSEKQCGPSWIDGSHIPKLCAAPPVSTSSLIVPTDPPDVGTVGGDGGPGGGTFTNW